MWYQHAKADPIPLRKLNLSLPLHIEQAILKAMSKDRAARHTDVSTFITALQEYKTKLPTTTDESLLNTLKKFTAHLVKGSTGITDSIETLRQTHGNQAFLATLQHLAYLEYLNRLAEGTDAQGLQRIWQYLGTYLEPNPRTRTFLLTSVQTMSELWIYKRQEHADALFEAVRQAIEGRYEVWLKLLVNGGTDLSPDALRRFYLKLVYSLDLSERVRYRAIVQGVVSDITRYEIRSDIGQAGEEQGLAMLLRWVKHARQQQLDSRLVISDGLFFLECECSPERWQALAPEILKSRELAPLPEECQDRLVEAIKKR